MQKNQTATIERHQGKITEGGHPQEPVEWWYYNAVLNAPGTPVDGCTFVTIYTSFRNVVETVHGLLIPPDGEPIDLSGYELPPGSIRFDEGRVNIGWKESWCRGQYPDWEVQFKGVHGGKSYFIDMVYQAEMAPGEFTYRFGNTYLNHYVVYRNRVKGTIQAGAETYNVTGTGYYEHFYGFLDITAARGWYWYWAPRTAQDNLAVNIGMGVFRDNSVPCKFLQFSADGKDIRQFDQFDLTVLEERDLGGVKYASRFSIDEQTNGNELKAVVTRDQTCYGRLNKSPFGQAIFVTGKAVLEGRVKWGGRDIDISGSTFGSAMLFDMSR